MFTMGSVAIARIAIEQDRAYSLGYGAVLGAATFVVMLRFIDSPIFCLFLLSVIALLADVIVRDCTIIDDDVDASGEGLIDSGRLFVRKQIEGDSTNAEARTHQPGRTVMYLAIGAMPLFGIGQFLLRSDTGSWARAQMFLGFYLFAALSLLVTTSFLGLRRYLRQRNAEMPADVSVSWLGGGVAMIAAVLLVAYISPLPGQALASIEMQTFFDSPGNTSARRSGWGDEGADKSDPEAATTADDPNANRKEVHSETMKPGGKAGDVGDGNREEGPAGKQQGSKKQSTGDQGDSKGEAEKSKSKSSGDGEKKQDQQSGDQQQESEAKSAGDSDSDSKSPSNEDSADDVDAGDKQAEKQTQFKIKKMISNGASGFGALLKWLIILVLTAVIARFVWLNWERFIHWLQSLLNDEPPEEVERLDDPLSPSERPTRPFSSYQNPIGSEPDLRRIVVITFQAFEAWARDQGTSRGKEETPTEFVRRVEKSVPNVGKPVSDVVQAYNRIVYGRGRATQQDIDAASAVWRLMR